MSRKLTAIVEREGDGFVAQCPELDVASQGDTVTEAHDNLAEALTLFFETAPAEEVERRLRSEVYVPPRRGGRWLGCEFFLVERSVVSLHPTVLSKFDDAVATFRCRGPARTARSPSQYRITGSYPGGH